MALAAHASRLLAASLALTLCASAHAAPSVKHASTARTEDPLVAATDRLAAAMERAATAAPDDSTARRERAALLHEGRDLSTEAAVTRREGASRAALVARMDAVATGLVMMADVAVAEMEGEASPAASGRQPYAAISVQHFHDVAAYVIAVLRNLTDAEKAEARQLIQAGEDLVAMVKEVRNTDHEARNGHLHAIAGITEKLKALHQKGLMDRTEGIPFLRATQVAGSWVPVGVEANGLRVLRASFLRPGSAWVMLENTTDERREFFVEMEFFDAQGAATGGARAENAALAELRPREIRRVLVPISPVHPRFWAVTQGFKVYVE